MLPASTKQKLTLCCDFAYFQIAFCSFVVEVVSARFVSSLWDKQYKYGNIAKLIFNHIKKILFLQKKNLNKIISGTVLFSI